MAGSSTATLVIFVASMMIAASVAGTLMDSIDDVSEAISIESADVSENIRTDIEVISDESGPIYNTEGNDNVTLLVKNTGARSMDADATSVDVLIDGVFRPAVTLTEVEDADSAWRKNEVVQLSISAPSLPEGDHRVKVLAGSDEEVFEFRV